MTTRREFLAAASGVEMKRVLLPRVSLLLVLVSLFLSAFQGTHPLTGRKIAGEKRR